MIDLSIIIVCYKGWDRLVKCLDALDRFTGKTISSEVIIVDNNSDDDKITEIKQKYSRFKYVLNKINGGFGYGCNIGSKHSTGEFLLFLNPDTIAKETEIERLILTARQNPVIEILSCRQLSEKGKESKAYAWFPEFYNLTGFMRSVFPLHRKLREDQAELSFPDWVSGSVILIKHDSFMKHNGFDEDFWMYFEDVDLCKRMRDSGGQAALCKNITIEHNHGGSSRINLKTTALTKTEVHISRHVYIAKHKQGFERCFIHAFLVLNNIISGAVMTVVGLFFFYVPRLYLRTLIFIRLLNYYSGAIRRRSWISPRSINMHRAQSLGGF